MKFQGIIKFFILFGTLFLHTVSCNNEDNTSDDRMVMQSLNWDYMKLLPASNMPITSAKDSISFAINIESVYSNLEKVSINADFVTWNVNSQLMSNNGLNWWEVKIKSSGLLPSFGCIVSFTKDGEPISGSLVEDYCKYNK